MNDPIRSFLLALCQNPDDYAVRWAGVMAVLSLFQEQPIGLTGDDLQRALSRLHGLSSAPQPPAPPAPK